MASTLSEGLGKALTVVFTSLVAPIAVGIATHAIQNSPEESSRHDEPALCHALSASPVTNSPAIVPSAVPFSIDRPVVLAEPARITFEGIGTTPNEALQEAKRGAFAQAVAAEVEPSLWSKSGSALVALLVRDQDEMIRGWRELTSRTEWRLRGRVHRTTVMIEVNRELLAMRIRALLLSGCASLPVGR